MTRINVVPVECLTDKHLMAEYRELPRIFTAVLKAQEQGKTPADYDIPESYCLGKGHVTFFYDKIWWLYHRYTALYQRLIMDGVSVNKDMYYSIRENAFNNINTEWWNDWSPTPEDMYLNMARLAKRSNLDNVLEELS